MKVYRIMLVLLIVSAMFLVACGGKKAKKPVPVYQPTWYGVVGNAEYIFAYGNAERSAQRSAESSAQASALAEAANAVEVHVQTMTKDFISEAGINNPEVLALVETVTKTVANQRFSGSTITNRQTIQLDNGNFKAFIQYSIPKEQVNRDFMNRVTNEEALYNRFRASQAFEELEKAVGR